MKKILLPIMLLNSMVYLKQISPSDYPEEYRAFMAEGEGISDYARSLATLAQDYGTDVYEHPDKYIQKAKDWAKAGYEGAVKSYEAANAENLQNIIVGLGKQLEQAYIKMEEAKAKGDEETAANLKNIIADLDKKLGVSEGLQKLQGYASSLGEQLEQAYIKMEEAKAKGDEETAANLKNMIADLDEKLGMSKRLQNLRNRAAVGAGKVAKVIDEFTSEPVAPAVPWYSGEAAGRWGRRAGYAGAGLAGVYGTYRLADWYAGGKLSKYATGKWKQIRNMVKKSKAPKGRQPRKK